MPHWKKYYLVERVIGMKKRQREKILKRAEAKLDKGFPLAGLSNLEMRVFKKWFKKEWLKS